MYKVELSSRWNEDLKQAIRQKKSAKAAEIFHKIILCKLQPPVVDVCFDLVDLVGEPMANEKILKEMQEASIKPNEKIYATLFCQCVMKGDAQRALTIADVMKQEDLINLNQKAYEQLHSLCPKQENGQKVSAPQVRELNLQDVVSMFLFKLAMENKEQGTLAATDKIEQADLKLDMKRLLKIYYTKLLYLYITGEDVQGTEDILNKMQKAKLHPDRGIYKRLFNLYIKTNNCEEAQNVLNQMLRYHLHPTLGQYNWLLSLYVKKHDVQKSKKILNQIHRANLYPDIVTYNMLLNLYVETNDYQGVHSVLDRMDRYTHRNTVTYNTLLKQYVKTNDLQGARDTLDHMHRAQVPRDKVTYTTFLKLYVNRDDVQGARAVIDQMQPKDAMAHNLLLKLHVKRKDIPNALATIQEIRELGFKPDPFQIELISRLIG